MRKKSIEYDEIKEDEKPKLVEHLRDEGYGFEARGPFCSHIISRDGSLEDEGILTLDAHPHSSNHSLSVYVGTRLERVIDAYYEAQRDVGDRGGERR